MSKNEEKMKENLFISRVTTTLKLQDGMTILLLQWKEMPGVQAIGSAKRWIKGKWKQNIQQPPVIAAYNRGMNSAELLDCALSDLRPVICGKNGIGQWPLQSILHLYTAGGLYCTISGETVPQKVFRQHTVGITIRQSRPRLISIDSRPTKTHKEADKLRYDELGYYPIRCSVHKCAFCGKSCCSSCEKCNQGLHVKTRFQIFLEKWQYDDITITFVIFIISKC